MHNNIRPGANHLFKNAKQHPVISAAMRLYFLEAAWCKYKIKNPDRVYTHRIFKTIIL